MQIGYCASINLSSAKVTAPWIAVSWNPIARSSRISTRMADCVTLSSRLVTPRLSAPQLPSDLYWYAFRYSASNSTK